MEKIITFCHGQVNLCTFLTTDRSLFIIRRIINRRTHEYRNEASSIAFRHNIVRVTKECENCYSHYSSKCSVMINGRCCVTWQSHNRAGGIGGHTKSKSIDRAAIRARFNLFELALQLKQRWAAKREQNVDLQEIRKKHGVQLEQSIEWRSSKYV